MLFRSQTSQTGGRIGRLRDWIGNETFCLTYGDGVSDVDITKLIAFHRAHGRLATVTAVRPAARSGRARMRHRPATTTVARHP